MVLAIIQARCSSSRLKNKVVKTILGKEMLLHQIDRIKKSKSITKIIVATSMNVSDDAIEKLCRKNHIEFFRGNLDDVLDRYYQCAKQYHPSQVVRITGDCPLIDWKVIEAVIEKHLQEDNDYTSNALDPTYPDGLDVEVMKFSALKQAWENAKLPSEREHVTPYIYKNQQIFNTGSLKNHVDLSYMRWTVDEPEDFEFVRKVYEYLYPKNRFFNTQDIIRLLKEKTELMDINTKYKRNEGMIKSLYEDELFLEKRE